MYTEEDLLDFGQFMTDETYNSTNVSKIFELWKQERSQDKIILECSKCKLLYVLPRQSYESGYITVCECGENLKPNEKEN